jgi:hypothetical protein
MVCQGVGKNIKISCYCLDSPTWLHYCNCCLQCLVSPSPCFSSTLLTTWWTSLRRQLLSTCAAWTLQHCIGDTSADVVHGFMLTYMTNSTSGYSQEWCCRSNAWLISMAAGFAVWLWISWAGTTCSVASEAGPDGTPTSSTCIVNDEQCAWAGHTGPWAHARGQGPFGRGC